MNQKGAITHVTACQRSTLTLCCKSNSTFLIFAVLVEWCRCYNR